MVIRVITTLIFLTMNFPAFADNSAYPDDAYSQPQTDRLRHFDHLSMISIGGGRVWERAEAFAYNALHSESLDGVSGTRWQFKRNPGQTMAAAITVADRIRRPAEAISFQVRNDSDTPAIFSLVMDKLPWESGPVFQTATWLIVSDAPVLPHASAELRFDLNQSHPTESSFPDAPVFPLSFYIRVEDTQSGSPYDFFLSGLTVHYSNPPLITNALLAAPPVLEAGKQARFTITTDAVPDGCQTAIELWDNDRAMWRVRLSAKEMATLRESGRTEIVRNLPDYLPARSMSVGLVTGGYRVNGASASVVIQNANKPGLPQVRLETRHGLPAVTVNGAPFAWSGYASYDFQPGNVAEFGASGANVFVVPVAAGSHIHQIVDPTWLGNDQWDFGDLDMRVAMALQANPGAMLALRVNLTLPPRWVEAHPDDRALIRTAHGDIPWEETGSPAISIASDAWRAQQSEALHKLIAYCKEQPWADRVIAFILTGEVTEEWFAWACNDGQYADYSAPMQSAFANWCIKRNLPFTTVPDPASRQQPGWNWYLDDEPGRHAAAYARFLSELTTDVIAGFAKVVKDATNRRCLVGAFHGYVIQFAGEPRQHLSGHFDMEGLLECPDFDLFLGIPLHNYRTLLQGYDTYTTAVRSIHAAGKLYLNENDLFSWLHQGLWYRPYDESDPKNAAISMHRRVFTTDMVLGAPRQWFSLFTNWHHEAALQAEFTRQMVWQRELLDIDRTHAEEIALVVDDASFAWMPPETKAHGQTHASLLYTLARTGAPVGVWLMRDLDKLPDRIRLVVVSGAVACQTNHRRKLEQLIEHGGRTIALIGPVGLVDADAWRWDQSGPARLTGLPVEVTVQTNADGASASASGGNPMAALDFGSTEGERPLDGHGRLLRFAEPPTDSDRWRSIAQEAGSTCYAPLACTVHACAGLVAITASETGELPLTFPGPVKVRDVFTGWTGEGQSFPCPFTAGQTRLFRLE